ncbi:MAG: peptidoglycan-binding protein LysM [Bacteroidetes bacterium]|nr:MAG: peptidoglycan-binding protein LysM [Bacteroidota bacterium]
MGLFSFIKGAGTKLFKKKNRTPEVEEVVKTEEEQKIEALMAEVNRLNIPVSGLGVELGTCVIVNGSTDTNADREKVILALGNVEGINAVQDNILVTNPEPESVFHEVKKGDTLSKIAKDVYGDPMKYPAIFEANRPMLSDPDKIYPGQILRIPMEG